MSQPGRDALLSRALSITNIMIRRGGYLRTSTSHGARPWARSSTPSAGPPAPASLHRPRGAASRSAASAASRGDMPETPAARSLPAPRRPPGAGSGCLERCPHAFDGIASRV